MKREGYRRRETVDDEEESELERKAVRLPAPSLVQTRCLVWPALNNWNNIHARRWMEGGLHSVHLKKTENFPFGIALLDLLLTFENCFARKPFVRRVFSSN